MFTIQPKIHAVEAAGGVNYAYDANGNMTSGDGRTLHYTAFDKVRRIEKGSHVTEFSMTPDAVALRKWIPKAAVRPQRCTWVA